MELYLEHTEPASKEVGAHTQPPFDLLSSWPHKSTLFPVWYVSLLDSILHFLVGSVPCWISASLSKCGLVLEPHSTACGVSFGTVVVFLAVMAQVCLPECRCYSCLFSFRSHFLPDPNSHFQFQCTLASRQVWPERTLQKKTVRLESKAGVLALNVALAKWVYCR